MSELVMRAEKKGEVLLLHLRGRVDERSDFSVANDAWSQDVKKVELHLKEVEYLNSLGIRMWIEWLDGFAPGAQLEYHEVPSMMVEQMNLIRGILRPGASLASFHADFYCEACDHDTTIVLKQGEGFVKDKVCLPEEVACSHCGNETYLDVVEEDYFGFLKHLD